MPDVDKLIMKNQIIAGVEAHFFNVNAADRKDRAEIIEKIENIFSKNNDSTIRSIGSFTCIRNLKPFISENPADQINQKQIEMTLNVMANSLVYWTQDIVNRKMMITGRQDLRNDLFRRSETN